MFKFLIVLLTIFSGIKTANVTNEANDYDVTQSPVFWYNLGFLIWGLISFVLIITVLWNFCIFDLISRRGKPLNSLEQFITFLLVSLFFFAVSLVFLAVE